SQTYDILPGYWDVYYTSYNTSNGSFLAPLRVNDDPEFENAQYCPSIAVDGDYVYFTWRDSRGSENTTVYFSRFDMVRHTFSRNVRVGGRYRGRDRVPR
ncbi:MAG: hypothetical protein KAU14_02005, partial [Thermoplasmata archaeon]|nr:hypothetical protein [Thermoplasmata archaeon]